MATVLDRTSQALADITGFIVDRSITPEKVIGQAWIISKSRLVLPASTVANYADAPWALLVKFPYPDLTFSVKAISLHPEFNKRAARDHYLAQAAELQPQALITENDIATITIEAEIQDLQPDRVQELNRALSLPLTISAQDLSGVMRGGETGNILQKAIVSGRNGVLNLYDERKIPFARVLIRGNRIVKACYNNLQNEFAICELMWRKPGGNFVLQSNENLNWGNIPEITMGTDQLAAEASRRTQDLPRMLDNLGGPNARYLRSRAQIDMNQINQQIRWVVERLWPVLDGTLPLSKFSERLAIDTYTALQALWELKHLGLINQAQEEQYHRSGQLGAALTPGHDVDLKFFDPLQAFYLDDLSTMPVLSNGNYFGAGRLLSSNTLLHTINLPTCKFGAIVLKEGRLVGVHNGKYLAALQNPPPFQLWQMAWIGSLSDMGAKRIRAAAADLDSELLDEAPTLASGAGRGTSTGMKARAAVASVMSGEHPASPSEVGAIQTSEPEILQKISKLQALGGGSAVGLLLGMIIAASMAPKPQAPAPNPTVQSNTASSSSTNTSTSTNTAAGTESQEASLDSIKGILRLANFKESAIPPFKFIETAKETAPKASFGMESEQLNVKAYFVLWPNADTVSVVDKTLQPPFLPLKQYIGDSKRKLDEGNSQNHNFFWRAQRYLNKDNKETIGLVGAFSSAQTDQSILVVAMPFKGEGNLDYRTIVNVVTRMFTNDSDASNNSLQAESEQASPEELAAYRQKLTAALKESYKAPVDAERANKCVVNFAIDSSGQLSKIVLKYSSGMDEVDKALQKAIQDMKFEAPPKTKGGQMQLQALLVDGELSLSEQ
ncbi:MAG: TonB C-terminal domain-containing protein [Candidatus Obscuribacterales bacterium]|nr:TonB C-terminal domain-containing protein [Candidatus Obscuribacterales bacterium]